MFFLLPYERTNLEKKQFYVSFLAFALRFSTCVITKILNCSDVDAVLVTIFASCRYRPSTSEILHRNSMQLNAPHERLYTTENSLCCRLYCRSVVASGTINPNMPVANRICCKSHPPPTTFHDLQTCCFLKQLKNIKLKISEVINYC